MNRDRLRQVADRIELEDRFNFKTYVGNETSETVFAVEPDGHMRLDLQADLGRLNECGTTGCVAGWAGLVALEQGELPQAGDEWSDFAQRWLGLTDNQASMLFMAEVVPSWYEGDAEDDAAWDMNALEVSKMLRQIADGEIPL